LGRAAEVLVTGDGEEVDDVVPVVAQGRSGLAHPSVATVGNFAYGDPDVSIGLVLGLSLAAGTWAGAKLAHALSREALGRVASTLLVVVGVLILTRLGLRQFA
ncbi:hypothetical protein ACIKT0_07455, partial [Hansschlegelia beijingensis]|uniref:hypothetical protein n=1 Tax=Hansschlegelia beijingensis TaxID=1133344 RepID=UPI00387EECC9